MRYSTKKKVRGGGLIIEAINHNDRGVTVRNNDIRTST